MHRVLALAVVSLVLALMGCTGGQSSDQLGSDLPAMWRDEFDQALADPDLTRFQRQVLSDYQVTDAEFQEARNWFKQCMAEFGWEVSFAPNGGYSAEAAPGSSNEENAEGPASDQVNVNCEAGTIDYIDEIYLGMKDNPQGLTWAQEIRACFRAHGVTEGEGLSDDQFDKMVTASDYHAATPEGKLCYYDPTGSNGMTVEDAEIMDSQPGYSITAGPDGAIGELPPGVVVAPTGQVTPWEPPGY